MDPNNTQQNPDTAGNEPPVPETNTPIPGQQVGPGQNQPTAPAQNNQPPQPAQPPTPAPQQPAQNPAPAPATPPPANPATPNPAANMPTEQNNGGSKKMIIIIGIAVIILLAILATSYFLFFSDGAVTKKKANAFMAALVEGDVEEAAQISDTSDQDGVSLLDDASSNVENGTYTLSESKIVDGKAYYLYEITGTDSKYLRVTLTKAEGKWAITNLVYGKNPLALVPGEIADTPSTDGETATNTPSQSSGGENCLVASDFDKWYSDVYTSTATGSGLDFSNPNTAFTTNIKFNPGVTAYVDNGQSEGTIDRVVDFYKLNPDKNYKISIRASVATSGSQDFDLADERAAKVKNAFISKGVPADMIKVEEHENIDSVGGDDGGETLRGLARNVLIKIDPTCN